VDHVDALRARLADFLGSKSGEPVEVLELVKFPVGFSWITYGVKLRERGGDRSMILRLGPPYGLFAPYSAMPEYETLKALEGSAARAPRAYEASDDPSILGAPFFLCEKVEGSAPVPWSGRDSRAMDDARRETLANEFIDALAALHIFDWRKTALAAWGAALDEGNAAARQIAVWREKHERWALRPHPMARKAFAWLEDHQPRAPRVSIIHGDYRLGNFLEQDGHITAILDWELVHLGDPVEDLGWAFLPQYRGGTGLVCGLTSDDDFLARYERQAGFAVDRGALRFWLVFALLKLALTHMAAARCFEDGRFNDMRMPAMASQIAPVLRQIEKNLERAA
jgi:aminoglycoside phosphotransferase (APT) family kinase protein